MSTRNHLRRIATAGVLALTALLAGAGPASAAPEYTLEIRVASALNLDVVVNPIGGAVRLADRNSVSPAERTWHTWLRNNDEPDTITIPTVAGVRCLTTVGGSGQSLVGTAKCDGSAKQLWTSRFTGTNGNRLIRNVLTGTDLTASTDGSAGVYTTPPATNKAEAVKQRWLFDY